MANEAEGRTWHYLGVGCLTGLAGLFGGAMLAVMVAKIVGAAMRCAPDADTGAPCNWFTYAWIGALIGVVLLPLVTILRLRSSRSGADPSERG